MKWRKIMILYARFQYNKFAMKTLSLSLKGKIIRGLLHKRTLKGSSMRWKNNLLTYKTCFDHPYMEWRMRNAISFQVVFHLTNLFKCYNSTRYDNGCHHGKGPMDGVGGCVKRSVFKHVLSGKVVISTPDGFVTYANYIVNGMDLLLMPIIL